jgi:uncharacterized protein YjeT (DUF2065 family)
MSEFIVALGLVFVIEGLVFAAMPGPAKRALAAIVDSPEQFLRVVGISSAVAGLVIIWLVRALHGGSL